MLAATPGKTTSPSLITCGAEKDVPFEDVTSTSLAFVVPTNEDEPEPQLPAPRSSAQAIASFPLVGSIENDG